MSHVATITVEIRDLDALERAAQRLGGTLVRGQTSYRWYGRSVGDYPLPLGMTPADLGKCDHAITFPRNATAYGYEIGIRQTASGRYTLVWDFWDHGLKQHVGGETAPRLVQAYAVEKARAEATRLGHRITEHVNADGSIRLTLTGGRTR